MLPLTLLSTAREVVGTAFLVAPALTSKMAFLNISASAILPTRMAGTRDLALGALTFYAARQVRRAQNNSNNNDINKHAGTTTAPLLDNNNNIDADKLVNSNLNMRHILFANIAVDALDVLACLWGFGDGTIPLDSALVLGIGASGLLGLGAYSLTRFPAKYS